MSKRLFLCVLILLFGFLSNSYGVPQYYTFEGSVHSFTDGNFNPTAIDSSYFNTATGSDFEVNDSLSFTFMLDADRPGEYTTHYSDGQPPQTYQYSSPNIGYSEYVGGSLQQNMSNIYHSGISQPYTYRENNYYLEGSPYSIFGGTSYNSFILQPENGALNFQLGQSFSGKQTAIDETGTYFRLDLNFDVTLNSISDTNPFDVPPVVNEPRMYGLFIGVYDTALNNTTNEEVDFFGNLAIQNLSGTFSSLPNTAFYDVLAGNAAVDGQGLNYSDIEGKINEIYAMMNPEDTLMLYFTSHGETLSNGDEFLDLGDSYFTDDNLFQILRDKEDINKWVIMDACHSGGFWDTDLLDLGENEGGLEELSKIGFIASATDSSASYFNADGYPFLYAALEWAFWEQSNGYLMGDMNNDGTLEFEELTEFVAYFKTSIAPDWENQIVYEMGFGDSIIYSSEIWEPFFAQTDDLGGYIAYNSNSAAPVPEPSTIVLMSLGLVGLAGLGRKKFKK